MVVLGMVLMRRCKRGIKNGVSLEHGCVPPSLKPDTSIPSFISPYLLMRMTSHPQQKNRCW
jgi:hypothetical protein